MKLIKDFLIGLHNREVLNENEYVKKMSLSVINEVVWGDFIIIK